MIIYVQKVIYGRTTQNYSSEPHKILKISSSSELPLELMQSGATRRHQARISVGIGIAVAVLLRRVALGRPGQRHRNRREPDCVCTLPVAHLSSRVLRELTDGRFGRRLSHIAPTDGRQVNAVDAQRRVAERARNVSDWRALQLLLLLLLLLLLKVSLVTDRKVALRRAVTADRERLMQPTVLPVHRVRIQRLLCLLDRALVVLGEVGLVIDVRDDGVLLLLIPIRVRANAPAIALDELVLHYLQQLLIQNNLVYLN
jgi:hypothetical protein